MQQRFLLQILLLAQHVSGTTMPIIRSAGVLYSGCCLWYFVLWFPSCWYGVELRVMCPVCRMLQHLATLSSTPYQQLENHGTKYHRQQPLYNALELLMMGIVVSETCWASNKICNKSKAKFNKTQTELQIIFQVIQLHVSIQIGIIIRLCGAYLYYIEC